MSEIAPERPAQLQPGSVITFADTTELHAFEDLIAPFVDPDYDAEFWATRPPLKGLVRPDDFNGPMADVRLEVMADPYACLLDSRQRGWQFNGGTASNFVRGGSSGQWQQGQYLGFIFRADAYTSGKKEPVSEIQAEIYYAPMPRLSHQKAGQVITDHIELPNGERANYSYTARKDRVSNTDIVLGQGLKRFVTRARYDRQALAARKYHSGRVAFEVLQRALMHPVSTPMRD